MEEAGLQQSDNITAYMGMEEILGSVRSSSSGRMILERSGKKLSRTKLNRVCD